MREASHTVDVTLYNYVLSITTFITLLFSSNLNLLLTILINLTLEELLCKQDVEKLKLFVATLGIDEEQIKASKGKRDLKYIIRKVLEGKLNEEGKTDEETCDIFKHMMEDLKFSNRDHETAEADQKVDGEKNATGAANNADNDGQGNNFSLILRELNLRTSLLRKELKRIKLLKQTTRIS